VFGNLAGLASAGEFVSNFTTKTFALAKPIDASEQNQFAA
jgi:hypothetical protein